MSTVDARTDEERKNGYQNRDAEEDRETETGNGRGFMKERPEICWQEHHPEPCLSRPGSVDGRQICERSDAVISGKDPVYMRLWLKMDDSCNGSGLVRVYGSCITRWGTHWELTVLKWSAAHRKRTCPRAETILRPPTVPPTAFEM